MILKRSNQFPLGVVRTCLVKVVIAIDVSSIMTDKIQFGLVLTQARCADDISTRSQRGPTHDERSALCPPPTVIARLQVAKVVVSVAAVIFATAGHTDVLIS